MSSAAEFATKDPVTAEWWNAMSAECIQFPKEKEKTGNFVHF